MSIEMNKYFRYLVRRLWLILLLALIAGAASYTVAASLDRVYVARAKVFIGNAINSRDPDLAAINVGERLAPTYSELAKTYNILIATIDSLHLDLTPEQLQRMVNTRIILDTAILVIEVTNPNPQLAADIANQIAEYLIRNNPSNLTPEEQQQMEVQSEQIGEIQAQIETMGGQSVELLEQINQATQNGDNPEVFRLTDRYNRVVEQLNSARATLAQLSKNLLSLSNTLNRLEIVEAARPPLEAVGVRPAVIGIIGLLGGAGIAMAGVLVYFEYMDNRLRTENEVRKVMGLPILGTVAYDRAISEDHQRLVLSGEIAHTAIYECYRTVQANVPAWINEEVQREERSGLYVIASPSSGEGRTFTSANLATVLAMSGLKVLLVDADSKNPSLHQIFQLENESGFAELAGSGQASAQQTAINNLFVLTSGTGKSQHRVNQWDLAGLPQGIRHIQEEAQNDVILFDVPASLVAADSYVLAASMCCKVILVIEINRTTAADALKIKDQFTQIGVDISGIIINKVEPRRHGG